MQKLPYFFVSSKEPVAVLGLGMDALVIVCSRNMNVIMVWALMLW